MAEKEVVILGVGITRFGRVTGRNPVEMAREAGLMALKDAGVDFRDIQAGFCAHVNQPMGTGADCFAELGMTGIPVTNVEVACASQSRGVMLAGDMIAAGIYDMALVIGVEKMPRGMVPLGGELSDMSYAFLMGLMPFPGTYAMTAQRHMHTYGTKPEHFGRAAEKSHRNSRLNPNATYQQVYTLEEIMSSRMIADPITMYMCSANADGATATVVCSREKAKKYTTRPVLLVGWAGGTPIYEKGEPMLAEGPTELLGKKVYEMSGLGPKDVDVAQVHDAFSPGEIFAIEELGFCPKGEGGPFVWGGNTEINGKIPVNTDGGLVSCGHPIGATGGRMIAELSWQLRGMAGPRQVSGNPKVALLHNQGLGGTNVMIFKM
ncbi:MAG: thiolase family protein [Dehalococcoidia bacterium]|nr:thiolase family protein [Dehalococcoidia bacterium]